MSVAINNLTLALEVQRRLKRLEELEAVVSAIQVDVGTTATGYDLADEVHKLVIKVRGEAK